MLPIQVPAEIHYAPQVVNHVKVAPGTNWDFSRSAIVTPIMPLASPKPVIPQSSSPAPVKAAAPVATAAPPLAPYQQLTGIPHTKPIFAMHFYANSAAVSPHVRYELRRLPKDKALIVAAYPQHGDLAPERVSKARARVVTAILRSSGHQVSEIKALGRHTVAESAALLKHDSVEVFLTPGG